jgi:hypothetical protein
LTSPAASRRGTTSTGEAAAAKEDAAPSCTVAGAHSFTADTQVQLADGTTKNIQDIRPGDQVLATDPQAGISRAETVLALITTTTDHDFTQVTLATTGHAAHAPPTASGHQSSQLATATLTTTGATRTRPAPAHHRTRLRPGRLRGAGQSVLQPRQAEHGQSNTNSGPSAANFHTTHSLPRTARHRSRTPPCRPLRRCETSQAYWVIH